MVHRSIRQRNGKLPQVGEYVQTFFELLEKFIAEQDVARSSRRTYRSSLKRFFEWFLENNITQKPDRETILQYKEWLDLQGLRPFTRANYLVAVRKFFEWTETKKLYPNIAKGIKGARRSLKAHHKDALSIRQIKVLLQSIDQKDSIGKRDYALINLLFRTGLRLIEIHRANIEDIEYKDDNYEEALLWIRGKGKEGKDDFVVLTEHALEPLRLYLRQRKIRSKHEPLFASLSDRNRNKRITTFSLSRIIKNRFRQAGLHSRRITAHSLRHTFGVLSIKAGSSLYEVQLAMRHAAPTTTEVYLGDIEREKRFSDAPERKINALFDESI